MKINGINGSLCTAWDKFPFLTSKYSHSQMAAYDNPTNQSNV